MNAERMEGLDRNEKLTFNAGAVLISLMMFCFGLTAQQFLARLSPDWVLPFLPWAVMFAAVEAIYSQHFVHRWSDFSPEKISYRVSEALVVCFSVKAVFYFRMGAPAFREEIARYGSEFFEAFLSREYVAVLLVVLFGWLIAARMAAMLLEMGRDKEILEPWARPDFFSDRQQTRNTLAGFAFFIGAVMIIFGTITRQRLTFIWEEVPTIEATSMNIVLYFVLALILLSLGQFSVLRGRWAWARTPVRKELGPAWLKYTGAFFVLLLVVILLLPTNYSLNFFQTFAILFQLIFRLLGYLVFLIMLPFMLLIARLRGEGEVQEFENPFESLRPEALPQTSAVDAVVNGVSMFEWVRSVFFWVIFLFVVLYAFIQFARHNEALWQRLKSVAVFQFLLNLWDGVRSWLLGAGKNAQAAAAAGFKKLRGFSARSLPGRPWNFVGVNRLTPRRRIFFFYRALLRRAEEQQIGRMHSQTPEEYRRVLIRSLPDSAAEIDDITAGFEAARYGKKAIDESDATRVKTAWERFRARFRKK